MAMLGLVYIIVTFIVCFALVHIIKLAVIGFFSLKKKQPPEPDKNTEKKVEPVYYIVEKKRAKKSYSEPKEIQFKK